MITTDTKVTFDAKRVRRAASTASFESLGQLGGALRKTVSRSIRKRKKPSAPGSPPSSPTGQLRGAIRYEVNRAKETVAIGPVRLQQQAIWGLHEFGGTGRRRYQRLVGPYELGGFGPIRLRPGATHKVLRVRLKTEAQVERAGRIADEANANRAMLEQVTPHYPARPFMGPALAKLMPRIPSAWAGSIRN